MAVAAALVIRKRRNHLGDRKPTVEGVHGQGHVDAVVVGQRVDVEGGKEIAGSSSICPARGWRTRAPKAAKSNGQARKSVELP